MNPYRTAFLVFSDLHGSMAAVRRVLVLADSLRPELILLLGDVLYHGPRNPLPEDYNPRAAAEALAPLASRVVAVRGNCDSEVDESLLPFPLAAPFAWIVADGVRIYATHGHLYGPHHIPPLPQGTALLYGHTHVPDARAHESGVFLCNPGSLALPKEGAPPCYGLFEDGVFTVYTDAGVPYRSVDCRAGTP